MGFFDPANPQERQEDDFIKMIELLKEIRDLLKEQVEMGKTPQQ